MGYAELFINIALSMVKSAFTMSVQTELRSRAELSMGSSAKGKACMSVPAPRPQPAARPPGLSNTTFIFTTICQVRNYLHPHFTDSSLRPREGRSSPDVMVKCTQPVLVLIRQPPHQAVAGPG